jgi:hypothetical protein
MAYLIDQPGGVSEEERQRLAQQSAAASPAAPGAPSSVGTPSGPAPGASGNFRDLSAYFSANKDQVGSMGTGAAASLTDDGWDALRNDDIGKAAEVQGRIETAAGGAPGMTAEIQRQDPNYNAGMGKLDSYLIGQSGTNPFADLRTTLSPKLGKIETKQEAPTAIEGFADSDEYKNALAYAEELQRTPGPAAHYGEKIWGKVVDAATGKYNARGAEYEKERQNYEAYRKRRAENLGEDYSELTKAFAPSTWDVTRSPAPAPRG